MALLLNIVSIITILTVLISRHWVDDNYDKDKDDKKEGEDDGLDGRTSRGVPLLDFEENIAQNASDLVVKCLGNLVMTMIFMMMLIIILIRTIDVDKLS